MEKEHRVHAKVMIERLEKELRKAQSNVARLERALEFCKECMNQSLLQDEWINRLEEIEKGRADK